MHNPQRQKLVRSAPLLLVGLIVTAGGVVVTSRGIAQQEKIPVAETAKVVARINGQPIYEAQVKPFVESSLQQFRKYGMRNKDPALVKRIRSRVLDRLVEEELLRQESQKLTILDIEDRINDAQATLRHKYETEERFARFLATRNLTREQLRDSLRAKTYMDEYLKRLGISEPKIPETRIREMYESNRDTYKREATVKVSHILIAARESATTEEKERARRKAEKILEQIRNGVDFADLAKQHSDCNSASGGGDLRYIKKGFMPAEFDKVAFALEKGAVSEVVKTRFGFHILTVVDKTPAGITPYEEMKEFIGKFLQQEESKKELTAHVAELRGKAQIEILLD